MTLGNSANDDHWLACLRCISTLVIPGNLFNSFKTFGNLPGGPLGAPREPFGALETFEVFEVFPGEPHGAPRELLRAGEMSENPEGPLELFWRPGGFLLTGAYSVVLRLILIMF